MARPGYHLVVHSTSVGTVWNLLVHKQLNLVRQFSSCLSCRTRVAVRFLNPYWFASPSVQKRFIFHPGSSIRMFVLLLQWLHLCAAWLSGWASAQSSHCLPSRYCALSSDPDLWPLVILKQCYVMLPQAVASFENGQSSNNKLSFWLFTGSPFVRLSAVLAKSRNISLQESTLLTSSRVRVCLCSLLFSRWTMHSFDHSFYSSCTECITTV